MSKSSRRVRNALSRLAIVGAFAGLLGGLLVAAPALAAPVYPAALQVSKIVADDTLAPADTLAYTITIDCSTEDCVGAQLVDVLPPEFDALTLNPTVVVTGGPSTYAWGGTNDRTLTVDFTQAVAGGQGIPAGEGYSVQVSLQVPAGLSPDWPSNGVPIANTATASATTAAPVSASAPATITIPYVVTTATTSTWAPGTTQFKVGESSTLTLTTRNTSNAKAETLTLLVPTDPAAAGNLFERVDLAGFGSVEFPAGSDRIRVDAYVAGAWVNGAFAATAALPDGVTADEVTGLRLVFGSADPGAQLTANGAAGSVALNLAQRSTVRTGGASLVTGATVTATVRGTVAVPSHGTHSAGATSTYTIGGLTSAVSGTTTFSTARIPAGGWTISSVTGRNASNGNLAELTVSQPVGSFLTDKVTFGGFQTAGAAWPTGATEATVTWSTTGGSGDPAPVELTSGAGFPPIPTLESGQRITGFAIQFRGTIPEGSTATVPFRVNVAADAVPASPGTATFTQTAQIDGSNDAGPATPAAPAATLTVVYPQVDVTLLKTVTPSGAVPAGGRSVAQMRATTSTDSGYVSPTRIVITDVMTAAGTDYWRAFDASAIAPTQIPAGATLLLEGTTDGTTWTVIDEKEAVGAAVIYQTALADGADLVGLRFTFTNPDGFGQGASTQANIAFIARATLRGTSDPTATPGSNVSYQNHARVDATGDVQLGGVAVSDTASSTAAAAVKAYASGGGGADALIFAKSWVPVSGSTTVPSQSGERRTVRLGWGVEVGGYAQAAVTDPADPTLPVSQTVFQAFDLYSLGAITNSTDALIKYDKVTDIEFYQNGAWVSRFTTVCGADGALCLGRMPSHTLSPTDRANTTGVRITFAEYEAARTGTSDPLAPPVGSGVASGPDTRRIDLSFQLRNRVRDAAAMTDPNDPWVTGDRPYHTVDNGIVGNTAGLALDAVAKASSSSIQIIDPVPAVGLTKAQLAQGTGGGTITSPISIPVDDDVAPGSYPTVRYTMVASNASAARAWYLRVTDQAPCAVDTPSDCAHPTADGVDGWTVDPYTGRTWDPATSPFQYLTIRDIDYTLSGGSGIVAANSTVTLWYANGDVATVPLNTARDMTEGQLVDVVGVSALFGGNTNQATTGGSIASGAQATLTLETRLRKYLRTSSTTLVGPTSFTNTAFSQIWDGVLPDTDAYFARSVSMTLVAADLAIDASTSIASNTILEANRTADSTVTMTATEGGATASPNRVTLENTTAAFWNAFELRSLGTVTRPSGADRARVDVQVNGSPTWTAGTAAASPTLPSGVTASQVTGIRVVFFKADGSIFSVSSPATSYTASAAYVVRLRATYRDSGDPITFPSTAGVFVTDSVTASAEHPNLGTRTSTATASVTLDPGTFKVDVEKRSPVTTTPAGETVDFSLIVENTGTGFLDNPVVTDQLPTDGALIFDPTSEITYSTSAGGILPTTGVTYAYDSDTSRLTFSWPAGSRLAPGETYTIVVPLQVKPGLAATYGNIVNAFTFTSDRTLAASGQQGCTNTSGNGYGVNYVGATGCRTSTSVTTISASAISSFKGVKGDVDAGGTSTSGAVNVNNAATACVADSQGFYRNPCAANTRLGATDLWKVQFTNGGNVAATETTVVDVLPAAGDRYLVTGASRGSTYRPVFAGGVILATDTTGVTTISWEVTTTADPCPAFPTNAVCSTATWVDGPSFPSASYRDVTAIRISYHLPAGGLPPAATLAVTYETTNQPTTTAGDGRAPVSVPLGVQRAWNSFGVYAKFGPGFAERRVEPVRAGVQLQSGPIQIAKAITGSMAAYAPTSFDATVSCRTDGSNVALTLPSSGAVTLAATDSTPYTARIDGIPLGSSCEIVETTTGATSTSYSPVGTTGAALSVARAAGSGAPVPSAQIATITNEYGTTSLSVRKALVTSATVGSFGPFAYAVACTVNNGSTTLTVPLAAEDAAFTLSDTQEHTITALPVTARCTVAETDADGATAIAMNVDGGSWTTVAENAPYTVALGTDEGYSVTVRNTFATGLLALRKEVVGDGEADYAADDYGFDVECAYQGDVVFTASVRVDADETHAFAPLFPVGTVCSIEETDAGGATTAAADASVTIATGTTTALMTNRFDTGSIRIDKTIVDATGRYGDGPFEAQVVCTWDAPGAPDSVIPLPGSGLVTLSSATGYTGTVTGLIAGADCAVTETKSGAATSTDVAAVGPITAGGTTVVEIENTFATGSLQILKHRDIAVGAAAFAAGPFVMAVECGIDIDGTWTVLDLDGDETQTLSDANGFSVVIDDILQGASCTVTETDAGLADSHESSTDTTPAVIPASWMGPARASVTNYFRTGELDVEKTVDETLVQGGDSVHYAIDVENVGDVTAGGVAVTDDLDADLRIDESSIAGTGWTCSITGRDADGFGGTLDCELDVDLGVGATAPQITFTALLRDEAAQDTLSNTAEVDSTTVVVAGDSDTVDTPVKWLDVAAFTECVQDAPWLDYTVDAHNLDVSGRTMQVVWKAADGTVIHTDTVGISANGTVNGRLLFPGAAVDDDGDGVAWPGWRPVGPGEAPDWENLVLDPTLPSYGLRSGAAVEFVINPQTTVAITYPPATATCTEAPADQDPELWMSKVASSSMVAAGDEFSYTMEIGNRGLGGVTGLILVDDVPDILRIVDVEWATSAVGAPGWIDCVVSDRLPDGFGGTITCELDRDLGYGQVAPEIRLQVQLSPSAPAGPIVNTATVTAYDLPTHPLTGRQSGTPLAGLVTLSLQDSAVVMTPGRRLATTGFPLGGAELALALLALGGLLLLFRRRVVRG